MTKYFRLRETRANNLQSKQWQTCNTSVLHLGWSRMCFTALVRLIDSQVLRRVLCFFLLPGCSGAWQTSQLQARSGRHHDSCKRRKWFCEGTFICNGWDCPIKWHPFALLSFPMSSLDQLGAIFENWFCHGECSPFPCKFLPDLPIVIEQQKSASRPPGARAFRVASLPDTPTRSVVIAIKSKKVWDVSTQFNKFWRLSWELWMCETNTTLTFPANCSTNCLRSWTVCPCQGGNKKFSILSDSNLGLQSTSSTWW